MSACNHYICKVDIKSPCCQEFFPCRICHDTTKNEEEKDPKKRHTIDRYSIPSVRCRECLNIQDPESHCSSCGLEFATYFCKTCRLYDSNPAKQIYHCQGCKICRIGPSANYFHCEVCACCLAISQRDSHKCRADATKQNCPICLESLFYSRDSSITLECGHYVHSICYRDMLVQRVYQCPYCLKNVSKMNEEDIRSIDLEIENTPMPEEYKEMMVDVLCNECEQKSQTKFHILGLKCSKCGDYNTRRI